MERIRRTLRPARGYQPIDQGLVTGQSPQHGLTDDEHREEKPFLWIEYWIFMLLGLAMLWAWNMFLATAPYFQFRFASHEWILSHFQSAEISVAASTNLVSMMILTRLQAKASYEFRIICALCVYIVTSILLALSTVSSSSAQSYFGFLMVAVLASSWATGLIQNGAFAFVASFGRKEYTQAIMTGQAVAGVLPCTIQIFSALANGSTKPNHTAFVKISRDGHPSSGSLLFTVSAAVFALTLLAFIYLLYQRSRQASVVKAQQCVSAVDESQLRAEPSLSAASDRFSHQTSSPSRPLRRAVGLIQLWRALPSLSSAIFLCFAITMAFPVFTNAIRSLNPNAFPVSLFIPAAFLIWNLGDLLGRILSGLTATKLTPKPYVLLIAAVGRIVFIPLYLLCNVHGRGALIPSDIFYASVQLLFGLTNGYLGSTCMISAGDHVVEEEKAAAAAFMSLCIVLGLTAGSLMSFVVGQLR